MASSIPRAKTLDKLKKLLARARSSNVHEASLAKLRADELIQKHGITKEEIAALHKEKPSRRYAGEGYTASWQEALAIAVGKRYDCRAMGTKGHILFEGVNAIDATVHFKKVVKAVEEAR